MDNSAWKLFAIAGIIAVGCMVVLKVQSDLPLSDNLANQSSDFEIPPTDENFGYETSDLADKTQTDRFGFTQDQTEPGMDTASYDAVIDRQREPATAAQNRIQQVAGTQDEPGFGSSARSNYYEGDHPFGHSSPGGVAHAANQQQEPADPRSGSGRTGFAARNDFDTQPTTAASAPSPFDDNSTASAFPENDEFPSADTSAASANPGSEFPGSEFPGAELTNDPPAEHSQPAPLNFGDDQEPAGAAPFPPNAAQARDSSFTQSDTPQPAAINETFGEFPGFDDDDQPATGATTDADPFPDATNPFPESHAEAAGNSGSDMETPNPAAAFGGGPLDLTEPENKPTGLDSQPLADPEPIPGFEFDNNAQMDSVPAGDPVPVRESESNTVVNAAFAQGESDDVVLGVSGTFEDAPQWPNRGKSESQPNRRIQDANLMQTQHVELLPDPTNQTQPESDPIFDEDPRPVPFDNGPQTQQNRSGRSGLRAVPATNRSTTVPLASADGRAIGAPIRLTGNGTVDPNITQGSLRPQLRIDKTAPGDAVLGKPLIYQIVISNTGNARARQVVVEDRIPRGCQLTGTIPQARLSDDKLTWNLGAMEPGAKKTIAVRVIPTMEGEIGSVATVNFAADVSAATTITAPKLKIDMVGQKEVMLGDSLTYTYRLSNTGSGMASNVVIRNLIPPCLEHPGGNDLEYEVGNLAAGGTEEITLKLVAIQATQTGVPNSNQAIVNADGGIKATAEMPISVIGRQLVLTRKGPARRYIGRRGIFENTLANESTRIASRATVVERIPPGMRYVESTGGGVYDQVKRTVTWNVPDLNPGQKHVMQVTLQAADGGEHESVVQVLERTGLQSEATSRTAVEHLNTMGLEISEVDGPVAEGEKLRFTIRARNRGTAAATGVILVVRVPPEMDIIGAGPIKAERVGDEVRFPALKSIEVGSDANFTVSLQARTLKTGRSKADVRLMAQVKSNEMEKPLGAEEAILIYSATE